ncbi:unnamed protein product [Urochloa humidicola]
MSLGGGLPQLAAVAMVLFHGGRAAALPKLLPNTLGDKFTVPSGVLRDTDKRMVTTTALMAVLATALFVLCARARLFGRRPGTPSTATRVFFRASFALFLPLMSYLFSQARGEGGEARANLILLWMLLVELLRKKACAMVAPDGGGSYSFFNAVEEAPRIAWIGYLIYSYVHSAVLKYSLGAVWSLSVAELCKRATFIVISNRSSSLARNTSLVSGYMEQLVSANQQLHRLPDGVDGGILMEGQGRTSILKACNYVVIGENQLRTEETPYGLRLPELEDILVRQRQRDSNVVTVAEEEPATKLVRVSTVWQLSELDPIFRYHERRKHMLEDICLSLALSKLLRRRLEGHNMAEAGTEQAREFALGFLEELGADRAFDMVEQELDFLEEFNQTVTFIPLGLPMPRLISLGSSISIVSVFLYCVAVMLVTVHLSASLLKLQAPHHLVTDMALSLSDLMITFLLTVTLLVIEIKEFLGYLFSYCRVVFVLGDYARNMDLQRSSIIRRCVMATLWSMYRRHVVIKVHQLNLLKAHRQWHHPRPRWAWSVWTLLRGLFKRHHLDTVVVTSEAKQAIVGVLKDALACNLEHVSFTNGRKALRRSYDFEQLEWACDETGGAATVILTWHLATALLEPRCCEDKWLQSAAVTLSRYCAYLVANEPGLLPDDQGWTQKVYRDVGAELDSFFRSGGDAASLADHLMAAGSHLELKDINIRELTVIQKSVILAKELQRATGSSTAMNYRMWRMLLELWAELLVFVALAPSGDEHAHVVALANGGEFITHVWAILNHAGISQPPCRQRQPGASV